jgi:DNA repair exonuclease SbcCD nuclease subunit
VRILHLTDTHLGAAGAAHAAAAAFRLALEPAFSGRFHAVLHTGDLFDRSEPPPGAIELARRLFSQLACFLPVIVLAGNHDRHGVGRSLRPMPANVRVVDVPAVVHLRGVRIGCIPHTPSAEVWAAQARELAARGFDLLAAHQSFDGVRVPGFVFRPGRPEETVGSSGIPSGVAHIACGHLHPHQAVRVGGAEVVCAGSTLRTSRREGPCPKGTVHWELGRQIAWEFQPLPEPAADRPLFAS